MPARKTLAVFTALALASCGGIELDPEMRAASKRSDSCSARAAALGLDGQLAGDPVAFDDGSFFNTFQAADGTTWTCLTDANGAVQQFKQSG